MQVHFRTFSSYKGRKLLKNFVFKNFPVNNNGTYSTVGTGDRNTDFGAYELHIYIIDPFSLAFELCVISDMH
jgi:hypothetical protein